MKLRPLFRYLSYLAVIYSAWICADIADGDAPGGGCVKSSARANMAPHGARNMKAHGAFNHSVMDERCMMSQCGE